MKKVILTSLIASVVAISCGKKEEPVKESTELKVEPTEQVATVAKTPEEEGKD